MLARAAASPPSIASCSRPASRGRWPGRRKPSRTAIGTSAACPRKSAIWWLPRLPPPIGQRTPRVRNDRRPMIVWFDAGEAPRPPLVFGLGLIERHLHALRAIKPAPSRILIDLPEG